eukprot:TRINITY_DN12234_c0_g1_i1.p1 TRINITY_DN12234_c0_g1~~TRINITY_DN12234_c0_g1_i1.p1  ORF type:complete len:707 (-),score=117.94 TRINITY_DN12234_c0_g1_i1:275-2395(-)
MTRAVLACVIAAVAAAVATAGKLIKPRFKWGQSKDLIFLSVMVRDLNTGSVSVSLLDGDLRFNARNTKGDEHLLELPLREDVEAASKHEVSQRSDKWGTVVLITMTKVHKHRWDQLVQDPKIFKGLIDRDWSKEDQTLEPEDEIPYVEDNSPFLMSVTDSNLNKTLNKYSTVVINVRFPWCSQCTNQDKTFATAAKTVFQSRKKDPTWKKVAFGVLDARAERKFANKLGAKCDHSCEYRVYTKWDDAPLVLKSQWSDIELINSVKKFVVPPVHIVRSVEDLASLRNTNTTCEGSFASETSPRYIAFKKVAGIMRGSLIFTARFGDEGAVELWPDHQNSSFTFDGSLDEDGTDLIAWIRPRMIPLLQDNSWERKELYDSLGLPLARIWFDDDDKNPSLEKVVRHVVRRVAKKFIGKIAFVEQKKSSHSYELRSYGLNTPEVYPAFGVSSNASYNSKKYAFEISSDVASSVQDFWKDADAAIQRLSSFCEQLLAGTWPEAHESDAPQSNWTDGDVKRIVWKTFTEIEMPERPLLLQLFGKWRADNEIKEKELENLAKALQPHASIVTVASYDTSNNFLPDEEFKREKYSADTEWYWVPAKAVGDEARLAARKLTKPKKDAPIETVIDFVAKEANSETLDAADIKQRFEALMKENPAPAKPANDPRLGGHPGAGGLEDLGGMPDMSGLEGLRGMPDMAGLKGLGGMPEL